MIIILTERYIVMGKNLLLQFLCTTARGQPTETVAKLEAFVAAAQLAYLGSIYLINGYQFSFYYYYIILISLSDSEMCHKRYNPTSVYKE